MVTANSDPIDYSIYSLKNVPLYEALYGENLISLGGLDAVDNMFSDLGLREMKALDIGFGLGGVAFYLAKKYQMAVSGVEIYSWMAKYAELHAPKSLAHQLTFSIYNEADNIPFEAASFDLAYSKGVLNHVKDKHSLFLKINRMLKSNGLFVIADWIHAENLAVTQSGPLVNETLVSYQQVLEKTGFTDISFRDDSDIFLGYVEKLLENADQHREYIEKTFGIDIFSEILSDHQKLIDDINCKRKFATRIKASKK